MLADCWPQPNLQRSSVPAESNPTNRTRLNPGLIKIRRDVLRSHVCDNKMKFTSIGFCRNIYRRLFTTAVIGKKKFKSGRNDKSASPSVLNDFDSTEKEEKENGEKKEKRRKERKTHVSYFRFR